jgi:hypothetical protein
MVGSLLDWLELVISTSEGISRTSILKEECHNEKRIQTMTNLGKGTAGRVDISTLQLA